MKDLNKKIKHIEECAQELLDFGNSREQAEGHGLLRAISIIKNKQL